MIPRFNPIRFSAVTFNPNKSITLNESAANAEIPLVVSGEDKDRFLPFLGPDNDQITLSGSVSRPPAQNNLLWDPLLPSFQFWVPNPEMGTYAWKSGKFITYNKEHKIEPETFRLGMELLQKIDPAQAPDPEQAGKAKGIIQEAAEFWQMTIL